MDDQSLIMRIIASNDLGDRRVSDPPLKLEPLDRIDTDVGQHRVAAW
jgi:hypothetical protein